MKAIAVNADYSLSAEEQKTPVPGPNEILIKVQCAGVNRADLMQRRGWYYALVQSQAQEGLN